MLFPCYHFDWKQFLKIIVLLSKFCGGDKSMWISSFLRLWRSHPWQLYPAPRIVSEWFSGGGLHKRMIPTLRIKISIINSGVLNHMTIIIRTDQLYETLTIPSPQAQIINWSNHIQWCYNHDSLLCWILFNSIINWLCVLFWKANMLLLKRCVLFVLCGIISSINCRTWAIFAIPRVTLDNNCTDSSTCEQSA